MTLEQILSEKLTNDKTAKAVESNYRGLLEVPGTERDIEQERYIKLNKLERLMTPQKPDYEADGYDDKGQLVYDTAYCPNCQQEYEVGYDNPEHCHNCGQALDWTVEQEQEEEKETPYCRNYNCEQCDNFCTNGMLCSCESVNVTADLFYECRLKNCACKNFVHR